MERPAAIPLWLNRRIWVGVLLVGLLGVAAGLLREAVSQRAGAFSGPITHRAPTDAFAPDSLDARMPPEAMKMPQSGFTAGGELRLGESKTESFPLEGGGQTVFHLLFPDGDLDLEIISPSGQVYGPDRKPDPTFGYQETNEGLFGMTGGRTDYLTVKTAETGMWSARVTAKAVPDTMPKVPYLVGALLGENEGGVILTDTSPHRTFHLGQPAILSAAVREGGQPIFDARVTAFLRTPDEATSSLALSDDGRAPDTTAHDGTYSAWTPKSRLPGAHQYSIAASRPIAPGKTGFERRAGGFFTVSRSRSHWTGRFRDFGVDTTRNKQFDELVIEAELEVTDSARFGGFATLVDRKGGTHQAPLYDLRLAPGRHAIPLRFDGEEIFKAGEPGPYELRLLRLSEEDDQTGWIALLDELMSAYRTQAYALYDFQRDPNRIVGVHDVQGIDNDRNGKYETLAVDVDIELDLPGHLQWDAWLEDAAGKNEFAVQATASDDITRGPHTVRLLFPGGCVRKFGAAQRFRLRKFTLAGQHMYGPERDLELPAITPSQFEGSDEIRSRDGRACASCGAIRP